MPYLCEPCRLVQDAKSPCSTCGGPVQFTLLAQPGADPEPLAGVPTTRTNRYGSNPHATRNYDQDVVHSPFWSGMGKNLVLVLLTMAGVGALLVYALKDFK